jgi:hypothetical protein
VRLDVQVARLLVEHLDAHVLVRRVVVVGPVVPELVELEAEPCRGLVLVVTLDLDAGPLCTGRLDVGNLVPAG